MALEKLAQPIDQLASLARIKDRDDEAKVRFLTRAVIGTQWGLSSLQRTPNETSCQRFINALYTSMRELETYKVEKQHPEKKIIDGFRKSLRKSKTASSSSDKHESVNDAFLTDFFEALFAGQRR